jgi:hypothetical protein
MSTRVQRLLAARRLPLFEPVIPPMPQHGKPCSIEQLVEYICGLAAADAPGGQCPHAQACAQQLVGVDPLCLLAVERRRDYGYATTGSPTAAAAATGGEHGTR